MKIWPFVLGVAALLLVVSIWPALGPGMFKSPSGVLVPLGIALLLVDRVFVLHRGR